MSASSTVPAAATELGPMIKAGHREVVLERTEKGIKEGAKFVLDGCGAKAPEGYEKVFYLGPTIFDGVTEEVEIGREEIFGPVIFTESGAFARRFAKETDGGMVGVNVGIPVPLGIFGFTGHKQSFFGDLHCMGRDGFIFFTESKNVTSTWFTGKAIPKKITTWDGTMTR